MTRLIIPVLITTPLGGWASFGGEGKDVKGTLARLMARLNLYCVAIVVCLTC